MHEETIENTLLNSGKTVHCSRQQWRANVVMGSGMWKIEVKSFPKKVILNGEMR